MIITITDARRVFCAPGLYKFAKANDLDFRKFVKDGLSESELRAALPEESALIDRVIEAKRTAENG
jgi:hypothetical protein